MLRLDAGFRASLKKPGQSLVLETADHASKCNVCGYVLQDAQRMKANGTATMIFVRHGARSGVRCAELFSGEMLRGPIVDTRSLCEFMSTRRAAQAFDNYTKVVPRAGRSQASLRRPLSALPLKS